MFTVLNGSRGSWMVFMDGDIFAFSKRVFQTRTANCSNPSFSVFPYCISYYILCTEYCLLFYTLMFIWLNRWVMGHA